MADTVVPAAHEAAVEDIRLKHHFATSAQQMDADTLGMWTFLITEVLFFGGMFASYAVYRNLYYGAFASTSKYMNVTLGATNTAVLICSSLTMVMAVSASSRRNISSARKWILATAVLGATFIVLHMIEWKHLINEGLRPFQLPAEWVEKWPGATPLFGATFFGITGMHMFHVFTGCIYLFVVAARVKKLKHEDIEISGLYWHFVDLVWMFVFPMIYLLSIYPKK